jgi:hypothetical protein
MFTRVMPTADALVQSAINVDSTTRTSPVDMWIGSGVRVKRTSRGMSKEEFCKLLGIDRNTLPPLKQAQSVSMLTFCSALPSRWMCRRTTSSEVTSKKNRRL